MRRAAWHRKTAEGEHMTKIGRRCPAVCSALRVRIFVVLFRAARRDRAPTTPARMAAPYQNGIVTAAGCGGRISCAKIWRRARCGRSGTLARTTRLPVIR